MFFGKASVAAEWTTFFDVVKRAVEFQTTSTPYAKGAKCSRCQISDKQMTAPRGSWDQINLGAGFFGVKRKGDR